MNITDLKIGDRVKYYYPNGIIADTTIGEGILTLVGIRYSTINNSIEILTKDIICKLEEVKYYKEIPITKENKVFKFRCPRCHRPHGYEFSKYELYSASIESKYCDKCDDEMTKAEYQKSFKFNVSFIRKIEFNQEPYTAGSLPNCFFKIEGGKITYHPDNPKNFPESFNGKEFTIEIREKI